MTIRSSQSRRVRLGIAVVLTSYMLSLILNSYHLLLTTTSSYQLTDHADAPCIPQSAHNHDHSKSSSTHRTNIDNNRPLLAVVSVCIPGPRFQPEYIHASHSNKRLFCNRWGAKCVLPSERLDRSDDTNKGYHAKWEKLLYINQTLHAEEQLDWVLWMDCDAAFTNLEVDWTTHIPLNKSKLMVASKDKNGINLGVFFVPNTVDSRRFIHQMYEKRHYVERMQLKWRDQSALMELMKKDPTIETRIEIVPQRKINSFLKDERNKDGKKWQAYDWIMHQVLCREEFMCTSSFVWTLESVAGREPNYTAFGNMDIVGREEKRESPNDSLKAKGKVIQEQSICNFSHEDIRSAGIHWYDASTNGIKSHSCRYL